jgi:hypothetical protein
MEAPVVPAPMAKVWESGQCPGVSR